MIYDANILNDYYTALEQTLDDGSIDAEEAGFIHGYLSNWRGF